MRAMFQQSADSDLRFYDMSLGACREAAVYQLIASPFIGYHLGRVWSCNHVSGLRLRSQMIDPRSSSPAM